MNAVQTNEQVINTPAITNLEELDVLLKAKDAEAKVFVQTIDDIGDESVSLTEEPVIH